MHTLRQERRILDITSIRRLGLDGDRERLMALRLSDSKCWVSIACGKEGERDATFMFCKSRLRGIKCPREGEPGSRPFELSPSCFEQVPVESKKDR